MTLKELNQLHYDAAQDQFSLCCSSSRWAAAMTDARPFLNTDSLIKTATETWNNLTEQDFLEAFAGHPKIGDIDVLRNKFAVQAHAEQGQVVEASEVVLNELKALNTYYEKKFGFIFIVCATGKSAEQMLRLLSERINNDRETELFIAAQEQLKILHLRLLKLLDISQ